MSCSDHRIQGHADGILSVLRKPTTGTADIVAICPRQDLGPRTRSDRYRNRILCQKGKSPFHLHPASHASDLPHTNPTIPPFPQSRKDAIEYYADKVTYVQKNLEKLQETIERKQDNLQSCVSVMQMKMQEERQAEQAQAGQ